MTKLCIISQSLFNFQLIIVHFLHIAYLFDPDQSISQTIWEVQCLLQLFFRFTELDILTEYIIR